MGENVSRIGDALRLFRGFHGRVPKKGELRVLECEKMVALEVGRITRLDYESKSEPGVARFHHFERSNRPVLFVSFDGSQAYILAGGYRFTSRGLVG